MFTNEDCDRLWTHRKQLELLPEQKRISVKKYRELYDLYCKTLEYVLKIRKEAVCDQNLPDL